MSRNIFLFLLLFLNCLQISAATYYDYDFEKYGLYYYILDNGNINEVAVVHSSPNRPYEGDITIPSTVRNNGTTYNVVEIADDAFANFYRDENGFQYVNTWVNSMTIGNNVRTIGRNAFEYCRFESIIIPNSVETIEQGAFTNCEFMTNITFPDKDFEIGSYAFQNCYSLTSIYVPAGAKLGECPFNGCRKLAYFEVDVKNPWYDSRDNCNAIIETSTNKLLRGGALTTIPNSVTSIDIYAFSFCSDLKAIEIPNSVVSVGWCAFEYCDALESIKLHNIPEGIENAGITTNATIYIPRPLYNQAVSLFPNNNVIAYDTPCATPSIHVENGKIIFSCETENAEFHYTLTPPNSFSSKNSIVTIPTNYTVSVYATAEGYLNSESATLSFDITTINGIKEDVNNDGKVSIADVNTLIGIILQSNQ